MLLALVGVGLWLTTSFREVPAMLSQNVPPTFFPRLVLGLVALLSSGLVIRAWRRPAGSPALPIDRVVLATATLVVAAPVAIAVIGTWLTIAIVCATLPMLWGERRRRLIAALALGLPVLVYLVFGLALELRFPPGLVFGSLG